MNQKSTIDQTLLLLALDRAVDAYITYHDRFPTCCGFGVAHDEARYGPICSAGASDVAVHMGATNDPEKGYIDPNPQQVRRALDRAVARGMAVAYPSTGYGRRYAVSPEGDEFLETLEAAGEAPELPESPYHRCWRRNRERALCKLFEERNKFKQTGELYALAAEAESLEELEELIARFPVGIRNIQSLEHYLRDIECPAPDY